MIWSSRFYFHQSPGCLNTRLSDLESFVLEHPLDRGIFSTGRQFCLEDDAEGPVAHYLALRVLEVSRLTGEAILDPFAYDFCQASQRTGFEEVRQGSDTS